MALIRIDNDKGYQIYRLSVPLSEEILKLIIADIGTTVHNSKPKKD